MEYPHQPEQIVIGLNAVLAALQGGKPLVLCTKSATEHALWGLPYGAFSPTQHRTFELGVRDFVTSQTGLNLGYVEQLYTFGDEGREAPAATFQPGSALLSTSDKARIISVGYLALARSPATLALPNIAWRGWYDHFPWEDWRKGEPKILSEQIIPGLRQWANTADSNSSHNARRARIRLAFGYAATGWEEERTLDRYELLYEAGLVKESTRDGRSAQISLSGGDRPMISDHRRILATAIGRLRGKLRYRPVIFEMMPATFTLFDLQICVEAILGFSLHKQNFRRSVENSGLVLKTGNMSADTGGRPAALFKVTREKTSPTSNFTKTDSKTGQDKTIQGLTLPRLRECPVGKI